MSNRLMFIDAQYVYECVEDCFPSVNLDFQALVDCIANVRGKHKCYFYYALPNTDDMPEENRDTFLENVANFLLSLYSAGFETYPRPDDVLSDGYPYDYKSVVNRLVFEMLTIPKLERAKEVVVIGEEALIGFLARNQSPIIDSFVKSAVKICVLQSPDADTDFDDYEQWADEVLTLTEEMFKPQ